MNKMRPKLEPRILISSLRSLNAQVANVALHEFEQIIASVDDARIICSRPLADLPQKLLRSAARRSGSMQYAERLIPFTVQHVADREYDLLFLVCDNFWQTLSIGTIRNWRDNCKKKVCYIAEIWEAEIRRIAKHLKFLGLFDHVFVSTEHAVRMIEDIAGVPCSYLPPATDTLNFCPKEIDAERHIFACNIGRREEAVHHALLDFCQRRGRFYFFDTSVNFRVNSPPEHRYLMSSLIRESQFFVANYAKMDRPVETGGHQEVGYRFFEGAAAGAVVIGKAPDTDAWRQLFDWPDAIIGLPAQAAEIPDFLEHLGDQPQRLSRIRLDNVVNSLLRHDWVYRWEQVLATAGLPTTRAMTERKQRLAEKARLYQAPLRDSTRRSGDTSHQDKAERPNVMRLPASTGG